MSVFQGNIPSIMMYFFHSIPGKKPATHQLPAAPAEKQKELEGRSDHYSLLFLLLHRR